MGNYCFFICMVIIFHINFNLISSQSLIPTTQQLAYQQQGIIALTHFNMATFFENVRLRGSLSMF